MTNEECVRLLYRHILGREPDPAGLQGWTALIDNSGDIKAVIDGLINSPEFAARNSASTSHNLPQTTLSACREQLGRKLILVDVGAQELTFEGHVYAPILRSGLDYSIIGFEPLRHRLEERLSKESNPHLVLYPKFVGDGSVRTFYINNPDSTSSLLPLNDTVNKELVGLDSLQTVRTEVVETERLDKLLAGVSIVDFLKLDIQGFELQALRGAESVLDRTNVIHCEVEFAPMYAGVALFSEIELHLRQRGFELVDLVHEARSPYCAGSGTATADQLIWGDAVFFKSKQNVKSATNYLSQALLAWLVYGKRSLAAYLLEHYDDIAGTKLAMSLA